MFMEIPEPAFRSKNGREIDKFSFTNRLSQAGKTFSVSPTAKNEIEGRKKRAPFTNE